MSVRTSGHRNYDLLQTRLTILLDMHNTVRKLLPQKNDATHMINENLVVRVAAELEAYGCLPEWDNTPGCDRDETCLLTLFFLRNAIVHEAHGKLDRSRIIPYEKRSRAYFKFCEYVPKALVAENERFVLDGEEVLTPLVAGCLFYVMNQKEQEDMNDTACG